MTRAGAIRLSGWLLALAVLAVPVVAVLRGWLAAGQWPVKYLTIDAPYTHVSAAEVAVAVQPLLQKGFFAVDLRRVRSAVAALPWVAAVEVRKRWPNTLVISLREHQPWERWTESRLVGADGSLFSVPTAQMPVALPQLSGPPGTLPEVIAFYRSATAACTPRGLHVAGAQLTARGSYTLDLAGGARIVIGRDQSQQRLDRFLTVWPQLAVRHSQMFVYADLRYANGFAMRWPDAPVPAATPPSTPSAGNT
jgi:cell division protein FtsQ